MARPRTILEELNESSLLLTSLHGIRTVLEKELGLANMLIATDDTIKKRIAQRANQNESPEYPYAYLVMNEFQAVKDMQPNKVVRRLGYRMGTIDATRATSSKGYIFPVRASIDLKYTDSDPYRTLKIAEAMMILGQAGALFFELLVGSQGDEAEKAGSGMRLEVRVEIPESVAIPISDSSLPSAPGAMEVTLPLVLHSYAGFFRNVSAVNSTSPTVTTTLTEVSLNAH